MKEMSDFEKQKNTPMSIEQVGNFLKEEMTDEKQLKRIQDEEKPITLAPPESIQRYLRYAVSLLTNPKYNEYKTLLNMRIKGYTTKAIANMFKVKEEIVIELEKNALQTVLEIIRSKQETAIPIVGGLN